MMLDGLPYTPLHSLTDRIRVSAWYRREQLRLFETLISVYSNVLAINPDIMNNIKKSLDDYFELLIPGSKEIRAEEQKNFVKNQEKTMQSIFGVLQSYESGRRGSATNAAAQAIKSALGGR